MPTLDQEPVRDMLATQVSERVDRAEWVELAACDPRAHVGQDPAFLRTLAGDRARWIEVRDPRGRLRAGLGFVEHRRGPLRARISGVLGTYGGPVAAPQDDRAEACVASVFSHARAGLAHLEMVWAHEAPPRGDWKGLVRLPTAELRVDPTRPFDHFLASVFGRKGRKECNRSERHGLVATRERDGSAWADFGDSLRERSAEWGTELPSASSVDRLLADHPAVSLFAVRDEHGAVIGAHLVLAHADELFAWVGTTARVEGANPATLLLREEARHAHALGLRRVNLGSSLGLHGVHRYKEMLGATSSDRWILRWQPWWRRLLARHR